MVTMADNGPVIPPGSAQLAALAQRVAAARPCVLREVAQVWRDAAAELTGRTGDVYGTVRRTDGYWAGGSKNSFHHHLAPFDSASQNLEKALDQGARELDNAAAGLERAQGAVRRRCQGVLAAAARLTGPQDPASATVQRLVAAAVEDVQHVLDTQIGPLLTNAAHRLGGYLAATTPQFSDLPAPDGGRYPMPLRPPAESGPFLTSSTVPAPAATPSPPPAAPAPPPPAAGAVLATPPHGIADVGGGHSVVAAHSHAVPSPAAHGWAPSGVPAHAPVSGHLHDWITEATRILQAEGIPLDKMSPDDIALIIDHESSGNPLAVNNYDSNAAAGHPSEGLMQTIGPTFDRYHLPGHGDIFDPVDNIIAGVRYAIARYGSVSAVPGVLAAHRGLPYVGY